MTEPSMTTPYKATREASSVDYNLAIIFAHLFPERTWLDHWIKFEKPLVFHPDKCLKNLGIKKEMSWNDKKYATCDLKRKIIFVNENRTYPVNLYLHEIAHCLLHDEWVDEVDKCRLEVEAEMVSFAVLFLMEHSFHDQKRSWEYVRSYYNRALKDFSCYILPDIKEVILYNCVEKIMISLEPNSFDVVS